MRKHNIVKIFLVCLWIPIIGVTQMVLEPDNNAYTPIIATIGQNHKIPQEDLLLIMNSVHKHSKAYSLPPGLVLAFIDVESRFDYKALSPKGCCGLMQISWGSWKKELTAKGIVKDRSELFTIDKNIEAGCYIINYLRNNIKNDESYHNIIVAYHGRHVESYNSKVRKLWSKYTMMFPTK